MRFKHEYSAHQRRVIDRCQRLGYQPLKQQQKLGFHQGTVEERKYNENENDQNKCDLRDKLTELFNASLKFCLRRFRNKLLDNFVVLGGAASLRDDRC
jgi:hypothetical protein